MPNTVIPVSVHDFEKAKAISALALDMLTSHCIPPSPMSYTVAYEYCSGSSAALKQALDEHLRSGNQLDAFLLQDLYERHIASEQIGHLRGMGNGLQTILHSLMQDIAEAGNGAMILGETMEKNIGHLSTEIGPKDLRAIATDMLSATQAAQEQNNQLRQRLESTREETESLKTELEQYRREALVDPLTGLFNRRAMDTHLDELMAIEAGTPLSVVMVDIDYFKRINDTYGHAVGDVVIRNVAETMRNCIRGEDFAVRYGGEEFIVLLPDTPLEGAFKVAETIRTRIESLRLVRRHDNFSLGPFTVSLGVAARRLEDTRESLVQRADKALYQSKNSGRNRVTHEGHLH